jgi:hypothetical protein
MSLEGSVLQLYHKYSSPEELTRSQRNERRAFAWQVRLEESKIEGPSAPVLWIGTCDSTLLLVVTTFLLTYKFTTVLLLLIQLLQTTTYTIITELDGLQFISLRDLKAMGVDSFIESQDVTKSPWDHTPRHLWLYTGALPHRVFQLDASQDCPWRLCPDVKLQYTRKMLHDILDVVSSYSDI